MLHKLVVTCVSLHVEKGGIKAGLVVISHHVERHHAFSLCLGIRCCRFALVEKGGINWHVAVLRLDVESVVATSTAQAP